MSTKLKIALVMVAVAVSACAQQEEPVQIVTVEPADTPTTKY